jgi:hypothetical protein
MGRSPGSKIESIYTGENEKMKKILALLIITGVLIVGGGIASASTLLFDRGLPTANLNNDALANRSNVLWADWETTNPPSEYWVPGDNVILSGSGMYHIDTVRLWTTTVDTGAFALLAGSDLSNAGTFSTYTVTPVTYTGGENYQTSSGSFIDIYQLDFEINEDVMAGTEYYFFLDGPWTDNGDGGYVNPYLHASNAALSGSTQEGADDYFQWLHINN